MLRFALPAFILFLIMAPLAWAGNITLALSDSGGPYAEFAVTLSNALEDTPWKITATGKPETIDPAATRPDLIVTAGSDAFRQMLVRGGRLSHPDLPRF